MNSPHLDERLAGRLLVPGFIDAAALQNGLLTVPSPRETKARVALGDYRLLELSLLPRTTRVQADLDRPDASSSTPR